MALQSAERIEADIIELCSEDDYGSWELWWNVSADVPVAEISALKSRFLNVVSDLVTAGKLIPKRCATEAGCTAIQYDRKKLSHEIDSTDDPDSDSYFWFGTE